jgi:hypothetical protein
VVAGILATACGGSTTSPAGTAIEIDSTEGNGRATLSVNPPYGADSDALGVVMEVVGKRISMFVTPPGWSVTRVTGEDGNERIRVYFNTEKNERFIETLLTAGSIRFLVPTIAAPGLVDCTVEGASTIPVRVDETVLLTDEDGPYLGCHTPDGLVGHIDWSPPLVETDDQTTSLTSALLDPDPLSLELTNEGLRLKFNAVGAQVLASVTDEFAGYRIAVMAGDRFISAPMVTGTIHNGSVVIQSESQDDLELLFAIAQSGSMPDSVVIESFELDSAPTGSPPADLTSNPLVIR